VVAVAAAVGGNSEVNMESIPLSKAKELAPDREVTISDILYFDKGLLGMSALYAASATQKRVPKKTAGRALRNLAFSLVSTAWHTVSCGTNRIEG
jgi:hypothetical protein